MTYPQLLHHGMGIACYMVSYNIDTCKIISGLFLAISDGILENDAFKHTFGDLHNTTWTQLLLDFQFFDNLEDHIWALRRRFVLGAADWLAGNNGSRENDKEVYGYSDAQWEYVWETMLVDGAWAVPSIMDHQGNKIKDNLAPEMMMKYIAHDLRCHIIVFDLVLDNIQFFSGNQLKLNNVVFDSPLLMYATGSHFQAVMQQDHEYFINLARELDPSKGGVTEPTIGLSVGSNEGIYTEPSKGPDMESSKAESSRAADTVPKRLNSEDPCYTTGDDEEKKRQTNTSPQVIAATDEEVEDQYSQSFGKDSGDMLDDMEFEMVSKIRK